MMKRSSLLFLVAAGILAAGASACTLNLPGPSDLSAPPPDLSSTVQPDMAEAQPDLTTTDDDGGTGG